MDVTVEALIAMPVQFRYQNLRIHIPDFFPVDNPVMHPVHPVFESKMAVDVFYYHQIAITIDNLLEILPLSLRKMVKHITGKEQHRAFAFLFIRHILYYRKAAEGVSCPVLSRFL